MQRPEYVHPTIDLDLEVAQTNESKLHWSIKSAIIHRFRSNPNLNGLVEHEKKTGDLIADVRCQFDRTTQNVPKQCVVEVQTSGSNKDVVRTTAKHLKYGFAVYWVYDINAIDARERAEAQLENQMSSTPQLGVASLKEGELTLGAPITWDEFELEAPILGVSEMYVPTYHRHRPCYDYGDFLLDGDRVTIYRVKNEPGYFVSEKYDDGQHTLPMRSKRVGNRLYRGIEDESIKRISPVRGPP